jgi:aldehyde dehydrogenase (NAD+)
MPSLFIDGEWTSPASGALSDVVNPSDGTVVQQVDVADDADVERAIKAARRAFDDTDWPRTPVGERVALLHRIADLLERDRDAIAKAETLNTGKALRESCYDVDDVVKVFRYYADLVDKETGRPVATPGKDAVAKVVYEPIGVCGLIGPWNYPLLQISWKVAPALAAGNTVVLKPASTTPLSALLFADVCRQADLPPGVVNIVPGPGEIGMALVTHPDVNKVAFTGSTEIGKRIAKGVAGTDKGLTLELGGKAANIVFDDAPLDQAVEGIVNGIYFNQGEVCCAGSRLLAQESIVEPLIDKLKDRLSTIRVGDPLDKNTDVGAINSKGQLEKITELVASGVAEGAELYQPACDLPDRGYFFRPTLFTNVAQSHRIAREEIFGPVLSVLTFRTPDEAIEKANNTVYGLSAGIWTDKGSRILEMAQRLKAGVVWANTFNKFDPTSPFGGYKESGFGREGGMHGLHAYVRLEDR